MLVLGIHYSHGAAAALVENGRVISAIEEEKLNRIKGYVGYPFMAVDYVLKQRKVSIDQVDYVAMGTNNIAEFTYIFEHLACTIFQNTSIWVKAFSVFLDTLHHFVYKWDTSSALEWMFYYYLKRKTKIPRAKVIKIDHHLAHAASAFYCSPWPSSIVITSDGKGDGSCGGVYEAKDNKIKCIHNISDRFSVGQFYQAITHFLGYRANRHEGKITGLAAYGSSEKTLSIMKNILGINGGNAYNKLYENVQLEKDPIKFYENEVSDKGYMSSRYIRLLNGELRKVSIVHQLYQRFIKENLAGFSPEDLAAGIQRLTEDFLTTYVQHYLQQHPSSNVSLAGGVFANVKVNQRISEIDGVDSIYVHPAMDDSGCALGAALYVTAQQEGSSTLHPALSSVYQGPCYSEDFMEEQLSISGLKYRYCEEAEKVIANMIHDGQIIGRYAGRLEWGPRALGNRSILARPTDKAINDFLNKRLKRTEFMPFAPSILSDCAAEYLVGYKDTDWAARYMTVTYDIYPEKIQTIAAAVHVDGTARPQVVFASDNPSFYNIIANYYELSGIPAVLNTSFNMHEEPMVCTPSDAIRAYQSGAVDVLSMGPFIVDNK